jgi:hypothetical protein
MQAKATSVKHLSTPSCYVCFGSRASHYRSQRAALDRSGRNKHTYQPTSCYCKVLRKDSGSSNPLPSPSPSTPSTPSTLPTPHRPLPCKTRGKRCWRRRSSDSNHRTIKTTDSKLADRENVRNKKNPPRMHAELLLRTPYSVSLINTRFWAAVLRERSHETVLYFQWGRDSPR